MANLITCSSLAKSFGAQQLFSSISFAVHSGDRIGIIGPNGSGKSTLLKIICGLEDFDAGEVRTAKFCRLSYLAQQDLLDDTASILDNLYNVVTDEESGASEEENYARIHALLSRAKFPDINVSAGELSGGWRKRVAICRAMALSPDVLVMDEPTNHLDIEGILWLEKMLSGMEKDSAVLMVSHDRRFLENCTNRIIEIAAVYPEGSLQVNGKYSTFLERRQEFLENQKQSEGRLANTLRREIEWLRRAPKARATKAKYRIDEAHRLQENLTEVRERNRAGGSVQIDFAATGRKTKKLLTAKGLRKSFAGRQLFAGLDITLTPGSRLALLGRNGCGKSTLMKILAAGEDGGAGKIAESVGIEKGGEAEEKRTAADSGTIRTADKVQIVHFDQRRDSLNPDITLRRALAPEGDSIIFQGRSLHVVSWAKKFLFTPEQLETPVGRLSGGEQARIFIAELMRQPADILLLDEPGNDLDIASLEVLEQSLLDFTGALVLVSHDRFLLDRVCGRVLGFDGMGGADFFADYEQWLAEMEKRQETENTALKGKEQQKNATDAVRRKKDKKGRLSYLEQREYDQLEEKISAAEELAESLERKIGSEEAAADAEFLAACWGELEEVKAEIERLYLRWEELEGKIAP